MYAGTVACRPLRYQYRWSLTCPPIVVSATVAPHAGADRAGHRPRRKTRDFASTRVNTTAVLIVLTTLPSSTNVRALSLSVSRASNGISLSVLSRSRPQDRLGPTRHLSIDSALKHGLTAPHFSERASSAELSLALLEVGFRARFPSASAYVRVVGGGWWPCLTWAPGVRESADSYPECHGPMQRKCNGPLADPLFTAGPCVPSTCLFSMPAADCAMLLPLLLPCCCWIGSYHYINVISLQPRAAAFSQTAVQCYR